MQNYFAHQADLAERPTLYIIDASSFLYRAYYALKPLHAPTGEPVQAVYGFCRMVKKLLSNSTPISCVLVWDGPGKTERAHVYPAYKATRQQAPADLATQRELIQEWADIVGIAQLAEPGIEADDLINTLTQQAVRARYNVILLSSDKDLGQLVCPEVVMYDTFKESYLDRAALEAKYGFSLERLALYFALVGDSSDNIPGVPGIGPKTATEIARLYGTLDELYTHLDKLSSARLREKLTEHKENAYLSFQLFSLRTPPIELELSDTVISPDAWDRAYSFYKRLGFASLYKDMQAPGQHHPTMIPPSYTAITITTSEQLEALYVAIKKAGACAVDTETNGEHPLQCVLAGVSLCYEPTTAYYIPFVHDGLAHNTATIHTLLRSLLEDASVKKYLHNAKFDCEVLAHAGIEIANVAFDTMLAASLVQHRTIEGHRIGLKLLSELYLNEPLRSFSEIIKSAGVKNFMQLPLDIAAQYAATDARQTFMLVSLLQKQLITDGQETLYYDLELPLSKVLLRMERAGITCDKDILDRLDVQVTEAITRVQELIIDLVGPEYKNINLSSPQQVAQLLFEHLHLPSIKKTAQKSHSTDQEVLQALAKQHPVPALMLTYRELTKIKSTYLDGLRAALFPDGTIHTSFSQTFVVTGRLSSSEPNLQNIPTEGIIVEGKRVGAIREAFKPFPGDQFIAADYSQMELRILAHLSKDSNLQHAFLNNLDIHAQTAAGIFAIPTDKISTEQRQLGKRINFSILYGLTPYGLSQDLGISMHDAKLYIDRYFAHYPGISAWMEDVITACKKNGYVTTLWGRRRYIPGINDRNKTVYDASRRAAINTVVQGTAAEIVKLGMLDVVKKLDTKNLGAKLLIQIHDELLFSAPQAHLETSNHVIKQSLESVVDWSIPLQVTLRTGHNWAEVTK